MKIGTRANIYHRAAELASEVDRLREQVRVLREACVGATVILGKIPAFGDGVGIVSKAQLGVVRASIIKALAAEHPEGGK